MSNRPLSQVAQRMGAQWQRGALNLPAEHMLEVEKWLQVHPIAGQVYVLGMDMKGEVLWEPYRAARDRVELFRKGPQLEGLRLDWIAQEKEGAPLQAGLFKPAIPSRCERFVNRQCPLLEPMGHEPEQKECNYWAYPRFEEFAPKIELYPEWQRFDCHRYYQLFQATLVLGELAANLGVSWRLDIYSEGGEKVRRMVAEYAQLCASPEAFVWHDL